MPYAPRLLFPMAFLLLALSGCGADAPPPDRPRTVMVAHPAPATGTAEAFAGEVRAREESPLSFRVAGNLSRRLVDAGDHVAAGQLLATLDPADQQLQADAARADLAAAEAELARVRGDHARYAALAKDRLVSRSTMDAQDAALTAAQGQARAARAQAGVAGNQAGYTELRAPRAGVIASRSAEAGQVVAAGQAVFTLAADGGREVVIAIPENRFREVAVGDPAVVEPWSAAGTRLPGRIREIAPAADPQTRTHAARVALRGDAATRVDLGQSARVYLQPRDGAAPAFAVPLSAVQRGEGGTASVWVVGPGDTLQARAVTTGAYGPETVPVRGGLQAGDWLVLAGGHLLRDGQKVAAVDRDNRPVTVAAPPRAAAAPAPAAD